MLTLYGAWKFIHSRKFSDQASQKVSQFLTKKMGTNLNFTGVEFSLFPLSTTFKDVTILKKSGEDFEIGIVLKELIVTFTYSSFIASELEIDRVTLSNGKINLKVKESDTPDPVLRDISTIEIFKKYNELLSTSPVKLNLVSIENVNLVVNEWSFKANQLLFSPQKLRARIKIDLENILYNHKNENYPKNLADRLKALAILEKEAVLVESFQLVRNVNSLTLSGRLFNKGQFLNSEIKGELVITPESISSELPLLGAEFKEIKGNVNGSFDLKGIIDDPNIELRFDAKDVQTRWVRLKNVNATVFKKNKKIGLAKLEGRNGLEEYSLLKSEIFFDLSDGKFTDFNFQLKVKNAFTNTFLFTIQDTLKTFKGYLSGVIKVSLFSDKAIFSIKEKLLVSDFRLTSSDEKSNILKNQGFYLENTAVVLNKDLSVDINANVLMDNTFLNAKGKITEKNIDIKVLDSRIDLKEFGPIAGLNITGNGPFDLEISGPSSDVDFNFNVDWSNFSLLDINLGKIKSQFTFNVNELKLEIDELVGSYNKSNYEASGGLGFNKANEGIDLKIKFSNALFSDTRKMFNLVFKNIKFPFYPEFSFASTYTIKGGFDVSKLMVEGEIIGSDFKMGLEEAEKINLKFNLSKNILNFKKLKINKARGELNAGLTFNLKNNYLEFMGSAIGLRMRDFFTYRNLNLEYDGDLFVDFNGSGTTNDFSSRVKLRLTNAFIGNLPATSSNAVIYFSTNDVITNASLLAGKIKLDSLLSFKTGIAAIKCSVDTNDLRELFGVLSSHNVNDKKLSGNIKAQLNTQISTGSLGVRRFYLNVDQFNLSRGDLALRIDPSYKNIEVEDGIVKNWDIRLRDNKEYFNVKGTNISNGVINIDHKFALKASLFEILHSQVEKASGVIRGEATVVLDKKINVKKFNLYGVNHAFKIKSLPGFFTNFDYNVINKSGAYEIQKMNGRYGEGDFKIGGKVVLDDLYPSMNLNYSIEKSTIPLFKRSSVLINSIGTLTGTNLPYKLNGRVSFMYGEILDDPAELMKENKVTIDEYKKYLPENIYSGNRGLIDLNMAFDTINPIQIKNNMVEMFAKASGQATGDLSSPELNMRAEIIPSLSKFKFKGHDFALNQGFVEIRDRGKNRLSEIKFSGVSKINDYEMKLDLSGSISNVNIDLSSEPALSKEDLLSLLTLGVTSDISKNLESGERRFVTTVGIGSLLVDQLKINEDLNSSLGLKLSVQPEFKQDESTLIQGKSAMSDGSTSRLKSATKVKVNKQVSKRVDVSLSSTIGGSLEQKQEMNINLNINKNFSLEGVYEVKPTEDENTSNPNSLGADLKWRKSF